jgi:2-haloacid dehalogenase
MKYKWLLFDADGTLFDYDRAEATALQRTFEQAGQPFEPRYAEAYRQINRQIWLEFEQGRISQKALRTQRFEQLFALLQIDLDPVAFSASYLGYLAEGTYLVDGAEQVIRTLHGQVGLMLITNGLKEVQRPRLARSAISGYFADIVISEEVGAAKPDARIFDAAFQRMGHPRKADVLMVGDNMSSDIQGGNDYGIDTCWFNPEGNPRELDVDSRYEIADLWELVDLLGGTEE